MARAATRGGRPQDFNYPARARQRQLGNEAPSLPAGGRSLPHATFQVNEDGEPYCRGIVFLLSDAA